MRHLEAITIRHFQGKWHSAMRCFLDLRDIHARIVVDTIVLSTCGFTK
jgi:hypothetical protein